MRLEQDLELIAEYAQRNLNDSNLADAVRDMQGKVDLFLLDKSLNNIPHQELQKLHALLGAEGFARKQAHLAILTQEALKSSDGKFIHGKKSDVVKALLKRAEEGDDRVMTDYAEKTMSAQIREAGTFFMRSAESTLKKLPTLEPMHLNFNDRLNLSIKTLAEHSSSDRFLNEFVSPTWEETVTILADDLPERTTIWDVNQLLVYYSEYSKILGAEERITAVQAV